MNRFYAAALIFMCVSLPSWGESRSYEGTLSGPRGIIQIPLTLDTTLQQVVIWTDSFQNGEHFDPVTALWRDGGLLGVNDDNPHIMPGQTAWDSGLYFAELAAGDYLITITKFANFPRGSYLADGFWFDDPGTDPGSIFNCPSPTDCAGGYYRLNLRDRYIGPAVPEPQAWQLLLGGLVLLLGIGLCSGRYNNALAVLFTRHIRQFSHVRHTRHHRLPQHLRPA